MPLQLQWLPRVFHNLKDGRMSQGWGRSDTPSPSTFTTSALNEPKPKNLQWVFSESSNPHRPGQGATAACASAKYGPRGCWFRKLMPGHPRQNEEIGRNCFAHWGSKDFNPPCPTLLTQANQDLWDSQERKDLNITLPTMVLTNPQCDHIINKVGGLQTLQDPLRVSRVSMRLYFGRIFIFNSFIWFSMVSKYTFSLENVVIQLHGQGVQKVFLLNNGQQGVEKFRGETCRSLFLSLGSDLPNSCKRYFHLVLTCWNLAPKQLLGNTSYAAHGKKMSSTWS